MQYQLVLQLRGDCLDDPDGLLALEKELAQALGDRAEVDGHDMGYGRANFFLITSDPGSAFRRSKPVLERLGLLERVTAAHRLVAGHHFTIIWPLRPSRKFSLV